MRRWGKILGKKIAMFEIFHRNAVQQLKFVKFEIIFSLIFSFILAVDWFENDNEMIILCIEIELLRNRRETNATHYE